MTQKDNMKNRANEVKISWQTFSYVNYSEAIQQNTYIKQISSKTGTLAFENTAAKFLLDSYRCQCDNSNNPKMLQYQPEQLSKAKQKGYVLMILVVAKPMWNFQNCFKKVSIASA